ncbi:bifunctional diguanylate cyclase/phosphodiesterase [Croceicoccus mobilis]|uniref:Bifunctional diguanylate cyclase/phosphodiesterase n=1 Tax=Croceicoccus mobilis TaxID=1703339 RepID=A0A916YW54_9SPHN|nr:EAL domain-containing protein [Croceicoccus mobilis]GGD64814.1 bifunctional diguanylate cyclase/phosphodiesterase [Croceicoccus mobilis]
MNGISHFALTALAGVICICTAFVATFMLRTALKGDDKKRHGQMLAAAITAGGGIWATHFVAMLGHHGPDQLTYLPVQTLFSLGIGLGGYAFAFGMNSGNGLRGNVVSGMLCGLATSGLHFVGVAASSFNGHVEWDYGLIALSIVAGTLIAGCAIPVIIRLERRRAYLLGAPLLALSVIVIHFTAMEAMEFVITGGMPARQFTLPPLELGVLIGVGSLVLIGWALSLSLSMHIFELVLGRRSREFSVLVQGVKDTAVYMLDAEGNVLTWNEGARQLKGYEREEIVGRPFANFYPAEDRRAGVPQAALAQALSTGIFKARGQRIRKDGSSFWADVSIEPVYGDGRFMGFAKITRDITSQVEAEQHQRQIRADLQAATGNMVQGLVLFDSGGRVKLSNDRFPQIFGQSVDSVKIGMDNRELTEVTLIQRLVDHGVPRDGAAARRLIDQIENGKDRNGFVQVEIDEDLSIAISERLLSDGGRVLTIEDVTERQKAAERLEFMASHDALTGLPNREAFRRLVEAECAMGQMENGGFAVAIVDLDRFKEVNDSYGHAVGDALLQTVSDRLSRAVARQGVAARLGGDEFAVFARLEGGEDAIGELAERLANAVNFAAILHNRAINSAGSVGIALAGEDGQEWKALLTSADLAMYRAKASPGLNWCRYESEMDRQSEERRALQAALRDALDRDEFHIAYQPQCSVDSGEIVGYEALLRWNSAVLGEVSPEKFIKPAEESGLIFPIGEWVLRTACKEAARWKEPHKVAINISPLQLVQPELFSLVTEALADSGLSPDRLEVEITESAIISDKLRALHNLRQIKALGVTVAIDDFGTGYSSLDTLNSFEFDKIKIDRTFLMDAKRNAGSLAIIKAVLALGRSLDLPVLAEGVESEDDLALLREERCWEAQGFYFGKPAVMNESLVMGEPPAKVSAA